SRQARRHLAGRAPPERSTGVIAEARLHVRWRHQEVFVAEILPQTAGGHEALELGLDLGVGQAVGDGAVRRALAHGVRLSVHEHAAERRRVPGERAGQVLVLGCDRVGVLVPTAVVGEVLEPPLYARDVSRWVSSAAARAPE